MPTPADISKDIFLSEYGQAVDHGSAAVFAGAGLSRPAGFVDWKGLLREFAVELGLDIDIENDLVSVAQYHVNANNQSRDRLNARLVREFSKPGTPTTTHLALARLPIETYWTTNYDRVIEKALESVEKSVDVKVVDSKLTTSAPGASAAVFKMHGDKDDPSNMILTRDDFEKYARSHGPFLTTLEASLIDKTFLFLGYSFTDPNLEFVLGRLRAAVGDSPRTHYTVMRREARADHKTKKLYEHARSKQEHRIFDLQRYGIRTVLVDEYDEIPKLIEELERRYYRRQVAVSGAAATSAPLDGGRLEELCTLLGRRIVTDDYNLVSGFGVGVGSPVIMGAVEALYEKPLERGALERRLRLRPFPQTPPKGMTAAAFQRRYREDMLRGVGFVIFIAGNKKEGSKFVDSPGVLEEYEVARKAGAYPIPIGASGSAAKQIWSRVSKDFDSIFPPGTPKKAFQILADKKAGPGQLLDAVFSLLHFLTPRPGARGPAKRSATARSRARRP
jgi:hypothetical protein